MYGIELHDWGAVLAPVKEHRRGNFMEEYLTRREHDEFARRIDDSMRRTEKRVDELHTFVEELRTLPIMVRQIRDLQETSLISMRENNAKLNNRMDEIEKAPLKDVNEAKKTMIQTVVKVVIEALVIGLMIVIAGGIVK